MKTEHKTFHAKAQSSQRKEIKQKFYSLQIKKTKTGIHRRAAENAKTLEEKTKIYSKRLVKHYKLCELCDSAVKIFIAKINHRENI